MILRGRKPELRRGSHCPTSHYWLPGIRVRYCSLVDDRLLRWCVARRGPGSVDEVHFIATFVLRCKDIMRAKMAFNCGHGLSLHVVWSAHRGIESRRFLWIAFVCAAPKSSLGDQRQRVDLILVISEILEAEVVTICLRVSITVWLRATPVSTGNSLTSNFLLISSPNSVPKKKHIVTHNVDYDSGYHVLQQNPIL